MVTVVLSRPKNQYRKCLIEKAKDYSGKPRFSSAAVPCQPNRISDLPSAISSHTTTAAACSLTTASTAHFLFLEFRSEITLVFPTISSLNWVTNLLQPSIALILYSSFPFLNTSSALLSFFL